MVPRAAAPSAPNGSGEQGEWWSRLNRHNPVGPSGAPPEPPPSRGLGYDLMGEVGGGGSSAWGCRLQAQAHGARVAAAACARVGLTR